MEKPLLLPLFFIILGVYSGGESVFLPPFLLPAALTLLLLAAFTKGSRLFAICTGMFFLAWGNLSVKPLLQPQLPPDHIARFADEEVVIEGVVDSRPLKSDLGVRLFLDAEKVKLNGNVSSVTGRLMLFVMGGTTPCKTGDRIRFMTRLAKPRNAGLPGEFDKVRSLAYRSVFVTGFVPGAERVVVIREREAFGFQRSIDDLADRVGVFITSRVPSSESPVLLALLLGDTGGIDRNVKEAYARTGVNHILSISGFHVGIIALFTVQMLMLAARRSTWILLNFNVRRWIPLLTLPILLSYLFLTGAAPATVRSVLMIGTGILALVLSRETDGVNNLALAALLILSVSPQSLFEISFQLSFLALWGILVLTPRFMLPFAALKQGVGRKALTFLMVSLAAIAATTLPVAYYFHRASATGLIANCIVVPLLGFGAVVSGFCAIPFIFICPPVADVLFGIAAVLVKVSTEAVMLLSAIPSLPPFNPDRLQIALSLLCLLSLSLTLSRRVRYYCAGFCCAAILAIGMVPGIGPPGGKGITVTFFSIGQGDSALVRFSDGKTMLIDGGGSPRDGGIDVGERLLAPALWKLGVSRLDYVVLTHPHPDHLQGLKYVVENFPVGEFWESGSAAATDDYVELENTLVRKNIAVRNINASTPPVAVGGATVATLAPLPFSSGMPAADVNEHSVVLRISQGRFSVLFTGDIGAGTEETLIRTSRKLRSTLLKVPHHGSRYSSSPAFINAVSPQYAVISAGYRNHFHLPARETLGTLRQQGVTLFRTDEDGTIEAACDERGENIAVRSLKPPFLLTNF